jgi:small subunit ribosomal protein S17
MINEKENARIYTGEVVSDKMQKTIVVKTVQTYKDSRFHKVRRKFKKYKVHDAQGLAKIGDTVEFFEGRPLSKTKYMYLARVVSN